MTKTIIGSIIAAALFAPLSVFAQGYPYSYFTGTSYFTGPSYFVGGGGFSTDPTVGYTNYGANNFGVGSASMLPNSYGVNYNPAASLNLGGGYSYGGYSNSYGGYGGNYTQYIPANVQQYVNISNSVGYGGYGMMGGGYSYGGYGMGGYGY